MSHRLRLARLLVPALCALGVSAAAAQAEPGVIPMPPLATPAPGQSAPVLATNAGELTYAAWAESGPDRISWAQFSAGGSAFGAAQTVTPQLDPDDASATSEYGPLIAADGAGNVTIAWTADTAAGTSLLVATKLAGATDFGAPVRIAPASDVVTSPQLFMGDDGSTTLTWVRGVDTFHQRVAIRTRPDAPFSPATDVYADSGVADEVAGGRDGTVAFGRTLELAGPPAENVALVIRKARGAATLDAPIELTRGDQKEYGPQDPTRVAVSDSGFTWASSIRWQGSSGTPGLWAAAVGAAFTNRCQLNFSPFELLDVDASGAWMTVDRDLRLSRSPVCAPNTRGLATLRNGDDTLDQLLTPDFVGGTHLTWTERTRGNAATDRVRTVYEQPGCTQSFIPAEPTRECNEFGFNTDPVRTIASGGARASDASSDGTGNLVVAYSAADGAPSAAVVDREIPRITSVAVEQGSAPLKLRLSVSATDRYSPPLTITWRISHPNADGSTFTRFSAQGASVEVIVPDPPKGISVRGSAVAQVRDAAGNSAVVSRALPLSPKPVPTPAPITLTAKLGTSRFKALTSGAAVDSGTAKSGRGTTLAVTTTTATQATLTLAARVTGRRRGATCSRTARRGKRCATYAKVRGSERVDLAAGTTTLRVTGRWRGRTLRPGLYRLTVTVPGAPEPVVVTFRIRR